MTELEKQLELRIKYGKQPTVQILEHTYYVNLHQNKLERKGEPLQAGISLRELEKYSIDNGQKYKFPYNAEKARIEDLDMEYIGFLPPHIHLMEIPAIHYLDPVGVAREKGESIIDYVKEFGLQLHHIARRIPWKNSKKQDCPKTTNSAIKKSNRGRRL